jgi:hypothetical protein
METGGILTSVNSRGGGAVVLEFSLRLQER